MKSISRLKKFFSHSQKANLAYLTAGDGGIQFTFDAAMALIKGGANMLEIGIPFSDPIADGPVIQQASQRAIAAGTTLKDILWLVKKIREHSDLPIILFSYLNPILKAYSTDFFKDARDASVDGILLVDCPIEESREIRNICQLHDIDLIYIISPSTPLKRIQYIKLHAQGFLYYACRKGTTGLQDQLPEGLQEKIMAIKTVTNLPIIVGFGISHHVMVKEIHQIADGVVVGSLFVKAIEEKVSLGDLSKLAEKIFLNIY